MPHGAKKVETHLEKKLRQLGLAADISANSSKQLVFKLWFPRPPYHGVEFGAAKMFGGYNFVGQLLGKSGCTLRSIKDKSGAKIELCDQTGNLNGNHPSPSDPSLHAVITADSQSKLQKAVNLICQELAPVNTTYKPIQAAPGGSGTLTPAIPEHLYIVEEDSEQLSEVQMPHLFDHNTSQSVDSSLSWYSESEPRTASMATDLGVWGSKDNGSWSKVVTPTLAEDRQHLAQNSVPSTTHIQMHQPIFPTYATPLFTQPAPLPAMMPVPVAVTYQMPTPSPLLENFRHSSNTPTASHATLIQGTAAMVNTAPHLSDLSHMLPADLYSDNTPSLPMATSSITQVQPTVFVSHGMQHSVLQKAGMAEPPASAPDGDEVEVEDLLELLKVPL